VGRLPSLTATVALCSISGITACEQKEEDTAGISSRAAAVQASTPQVSPEPVPAPTAAATGSASAGAGASGGDRKLCAAQMSKPGREVPKAAISRKGNPEPPAEIPLADGKWTWINFWAAWCVPCKEEIPRLKGWEKHFAATETPLRVVFVSLDDDQRQLESFLSAQPPDGLRSTYWLTDGKERETWLKGIDVEGDPRLPAHLLVDAKGKLRCIIDGAVEDGDLPRVAHLLTR
jgi:thiol-disulfide isomerase/thioredoxin